VAAICNTGTKEFPFTAEVMEVEAARSALNEYENENVNGFVEMIQRSEESRIIQGGAV
jgi:predicted outer membrane protein